MSARSASLLMATSNSANEQVVIHSHSLYLSSTVLDEPQALWSGRGEMVGEQMFRESSDRTEATSPSTSNTATSPRKQTRVTMRRVVTNLVLAYFHMSFLSSFRSHICEMTSWQCTISQVTGIVTPCDKKVRASVTHCRRLGSGSLVAVSSGSDGGTK